MSYPVNCTCRCTQSELTQVVGKVSQTVTEPARLIDQGLASQRSFPFALLTQHLIHQLSVALYYSHQRTTGILFRKQNKHAYSYCLHDEILTELQITIGPVQVNGKLLTSVLRSILASVIQVYKENFAQILLRMYIVTTWAYL